MPYYYDLHSYGPKKKGAGLPVSAKEKVKAIKPKKGKKANTSKIGKQSPGKAAVKKSAPKIKAAKSRKKR